jgi:YfiR/HmsC-like
MYVLKSTNVNMFNLYLRFFNKIPVAITVLLLASHVVLSAQLYPCKEYQLKAVFIFNFTQFVEWPSSSFSTDDAPLVIGVMGENPFGSYLDETVSREKVNGHPLIVRYYKETEEIKECHLLFIRLTDSNRQREVVAYLKGRSILTVSDADNFLQDGGMVGFLTKNDKIQFQINLEATKKADVAISAKLLKLAEIFSPVKNKN